MVLSSRENGGGVGEGPETEQNRELTAIQKKEEFPGFMET